MLLTPRRVQTAFNKDCPDCHNTFTIAYSDEQVTSHWIPAALLNNTGAECVVCNILRGEIAVPWDLELYTCAKCGRTGGGARPRLQICVRCRAVYYCNRECQRAHWSQHRGSCVGHAA